MTAAIGLFSDSVCSEPCVANCPLLQHGRPLCCRLCSARGMSLRTKIRTTPCEARRFFFLSSFLISFAERPGPSEHYGQGTSLALPAGFPSGP